MPGPSGFAAFATTLHILEVLSLSAVLLGLILCVCTDLIEAAASYSAPQCLLHNYDVYVIN